MKDYSYQIGVIFVSVNSVGSFCVCVCWFCSVGLRILSHELQDGLPERIVRELKPEATGAEGYPEKGADVVFRGLHSTYSTDYYHQKLT